MKLGSYYAQLLGGMGAAAVAYTTVDRFGWSRTAAVTAVLCRTVFLTSGTYLINQTLDKCLPVEQDKTLEARVSYRRNIMRASLIGMLFFLVCKVGHVTAGKLGAPISLAESIGIGSFYTVFGNIFAMTLNF